MTGPDDTTGPGGPASPEAAADTVGPVGFVGLGSMGSVLAGNLVAAGHAVVAHDAHAPERTPAGATHVPAVAEVARRAAVVVLSLPDGAASEQVARQVVAVPAAERRTTHVVDTSTVGVEAARAIAALLDEHGVAYVDAPVSGGVAGARARTLTVMVAGAPDACARVEPVLAGLSDRRRRVGERPGLGQAMKLANNFLSATALAATSEAVAFGLAAGLDMATMLDVLNQASGRSGATDDKFPTHVLTGRYASGFANSLMAKDVRLYLRAVEDQNGPAALGAVTAAVWERFAAAEPGVDFTRIYPFVVSRAGAPTDESDTTGPTEPTDPTADARRGAS
ncbi:MAG TPA: NAD(P)-dependent oxidoreductase [Acidimicrobiales bacterium]